jgi:hypothetical protein
LAAQPYIAGETFSVAGVLYAGASALFMNSPLLAAGLNRHLIRTDPTMTRDTDPPSLSDVELDPFAIVELQSNRRTVVTHSGTMTFDEAAQRFANELQGYDWREFLTERERQARNHAAELFIGMSRIGALAALMAEIDLHYARLLWTANVPLEVGTLRMLALADEAQELTYQLHLTNVRALSDDARIGYLLENGDEILAWGDARVYLVASNR